jgi:hypothetical protein
MYYLKYTLKSREKLRKKSQIANRLESNRTGANSESCRRKSLALRRFFSAKVADVLSEDKYVGK